MISCMSQTIPLYVCVCGTGHYSLQGICLHIQTCSFVNSILNDNESVTKAKEIGCTSPPVVMSYNYPKDGHPKVTDIVKNELTIFTKLESAYHVPYGIDTKSESSEIDTKSKSSVSKIQYKYNLSDTIRKCRFIDRRINEKFKLISNLVNSQIDTGEWGARNIQCGRIEISVCNETVIPIRGGRAAKKVGNGCWKEICKICDIPKNYMSEIVAYAKYISGVDKGSEWKMGSFNLILTNNKEKQQEHLDLAFPLAQFALTLSHEVDTTISYKVTANTTVDTMPKLGDLLQQISKQWKGMGDKSNVKKLVDIIKKMDHNECNVTNMITNKGCGQLFQIMETSDKKNGCSYPKYFGYEWMLIKNAPTCTYTRIDGGIVHSGSGISTNRVRTILFWSGRPQQKSKKYDPDTQETKLSVMVEIIRVLWVENPLLRQQMVGFMYHIYNSCKQNYQQFHQEFRGPELMTRC